MKHTFFETLLAGGPHPSLGEHARTYQRIIGSWAGEVHNHMLGGAPPTGSIEAHFAWVLEGRAVQDVWITPARCDRGALAPAKLDWYGTTLRVFDPASESWRTVWTDPASQRRLELVGRRRGDDIVQIGMRDGRPMRWTFSEIQRDSFNWQGHLLSFDGKTWEIEVAIAFRRLA